MTIFHILIADDDDEIRHLFADLIHAQYPSAALTLVADGAAALQCATTSSVDLLLTDQVVSDLSPQPFTH